MNAQHDERVVPVKLKHTRNPRSVMVENLREMNHEQSRAQATYKAEHTTVERRRYERRAHAIIARDRRNYEQRKQ